jgi:hypothetical protein
MEDGWNWVSVVFIGRFFIVGVGISVSAKKVLITLMIQSENNSTSGPKVSYNCKL